MRNSSKRWKEMQLGSLRKCVTTGEEKESIAGKKMQFYAAQNPRFAIRTVKLLLAKASRVALEPPQINTKWYIYTKLERTSERKMRWTAKRERLKLKHIEWSVGFPWRGTTCIISLPLNILISYSKNCFEYSWCICVANLYAILHS